MERNILLALLGMFAMTSGFLKSRDRVREYMGGPGLGVMELIAGFVLLISQGPNMAEQGTRMLIGWATIGVMTVSNLHAFFRARSVTQRRIESEGRRLYTQVKFEQALEGKGVEDPARVEPWEIPASPADDGPATPGDSEGDQPEVHEGDAEDAHDDPHDEDVPGA